MNSSRAIKRTFPALLAAVAMAAAARAQSAPLTLDQAVGDSLKRYPAIRVSQEQINGASAAIELARTAYLPKIDALAQANRATRNNVFGILLPQTVIPSMSGPVIGSNNLGSVWGSAIGGLVSWEPFDFGLRSANVAAANASRTLSQAAEKRTEFDVAAATADAYLTLVAAQATVRAARAGADRAETILKTIAAQVGAELRPGADRSRAEAELAAARTQVIQAEQAIEVSRATLAQFTGADPSQIAVASAGLAQMPPDQAPAPFNAAANPESIEQNAAVEQARAQLRALERSYFPRFYLQGAAYARGSGAETNGDRLGGVNGLAPSFQNYALGFSVTFTVSELPALRAREAEQSAAVREQAARADRIAVDLRAQWNRAVAALNGARKVAANTPTEVSAARAALQQATARYQAGLGIIDDVAEAQRLLTQAEIDDALARLAVWRALLGIATAAGDLQPFIAEVGQ
jgi:outer membrane protein TolC